MKIQKFVDAGGAAIQSREVEFNGVTDTFDFKRLPAIEMDNLRAGMFDQNGNAIADKQTTYRSRLVAACLVDEGQTFTPGEIGTWPDGLVSALVRACNEVNGFGAKAVKVAEKNSEATPAAGG